MLNYYMVTAGIKNTEYEYFERIWAHSNLDAEYELITKIRNDGWSIDDIEYCDSENLTERIYCKLK